MELFARIFVLLAVSGASRGTIDKFLEGSNNEDSSDFIDPHSFYYNKHTQLEEAISEMESATDESDGSYQVYHEKCNEIFKDCLNNRLKDIPDELFSRRLVNMLLSSASFEENSDFARGSILIEITSSELRKLRSFGLGEITIRDVDYFITSIFKTPEKSIFPDIFTILNYLGMFFFIHKEIIATCIAVLYITWLLWSTRWNMIRFTGVSIFIIFVASFVITYFQLLKEAEIKLTVKQVQFPEMPVQCQPQLMNWWQKVLHMYDSREHCQNYYESQMENPLLHVTPAQALSHMLSTFILHPLGILGKAIGEFVKQSTQHLWAPMQIVIAPLMTIAVIILIIIGFICIAGGSCRWGIGPLTLFSLRGSNRTVERPQISSKDKREPIEHILKLEVLQCDQTQQVVTDTVRLIDSTKNDSLSIEKHEETIGENKNTVNNPERSENLMLSTVDSGVGDMNVVKDVIPKSECADVCEKERDKMKIECGGDGA